MLCCPDAVTVHIYARCRAGAWARSQFYNHSMLLRWCTCVHGCQVPSNAPCPSSKARKAALADQLELWRHEHMHMSLCLCKRWLCMQWCKVQQKRGSSVRAGRCIARCSCGTLCHRTSVLQILCLCFQNVNFDLLSSKATPNSHLGLLVNTFIHPSLTQCCGDAQQLKKQEGSLPSLVSCGKPNITLQVSQLVP